MKRETRSTTQKRLARERRRMKAPVIMVTGEELLLRNDDPNETGYLIVENSVFDIKKESVAGLKEIFAKQGAHNVIQDQVGDTKVTYSSFRQQVTLFMTKNKQDLSKETTSLYNDVKPPLRLPLFGDETSLGSIVYEDLSQIINYIKTMMNFGDSFTDEEVLVSILKSINGGTKQGPHRDFQYSDQWDEASLIKQKSFQESPKSLLFCVDDYLVIGIYPGSHKNTITNEIIIRLKKGQAILFHSELVHYGCRYQSDNYRVHFYIDSFTIIRPPEVSYLIEASEIVTTTSDKDTIRISIEDSSDEEEVVITNTKTRADVITITIEDSSETD